MTPQQNSYRLGAHRCHRLGSIVVSWVSRNTPTLVNVGKLVNFFLTSSRTSLSLSYLEPTSHRRESSGNCSPHSGLGYLFYSFLLVWVVTPKNCNSFVCALFDRTVDIQCLFCPRCHRREKLFNKRIRLLRPGERHVCVN